MAKVKQINKRCPFQADCGKAKCMFVGKELGCMYYDANAYGENVIEDQEALRKHEDSIAVQRQEEALLAELPDEVPVEILPARSAQEIAIEINVIKRKAAEDLLKAYIDTGRLLAEVKPKIEHGKWGEWLEENVDYSVSTANKMMRLAAETDRMAQLEMFRSDGQELFEGLTIHKALALLDVPITERKEFIEQHDVDEKSVRELREEIKAEKAAREQAEKALEAAKGRVDDADRNNADLKEKLEAADLQIALMKQTAVLSDADRERIEKEAREKADDAAKNKIEAAQKKAEKELEKARAEGAEAVKKVEADKQAAITAAVEEAKKAAERESAERIRALEEKLKAAIVASSPYLVRFETCLKAFQDDYSRMVEVVSDAEREEPEIGIRLRAALGMIVDRLKGDNNGNG